MAERVRDDRPSVVCVAGRRVVDVLAEMGVRTVLLGDPTPIDLACTVDVPVDVDLDDWTATEAAVRRIHDAHPLDAVLSVYDSCLPLAGYLAARLNVAGLDLPAAMNCGNKLRMRLALEGAEIPGPAYVVVGDPDEGEAAAARLGHPVVVKKITDARGKGSRVCRNPADVGEAIAVLREETSPNLLIEEYVEGPEYAVQTVTTGGVTEVVSVLAQQTAEGQRPVEIGYDFPSGLDGESLRRLGDFVARALRALGFGDGIAHAQVRLSGSAPVLINVKPRPPGGRLCAVTEAVSGVDMVRAAVEVALGRPISRRAPTARYARYRCMTTDVAGTVDYEPVTPHGAKGELPPPTVAMDVEPGDEVLPLDHPGGGVYGRIVVYTESAAELEPAYRSVLDVLRPRVHPSGT
ncbi:hypothetical protein GCM10022226_56740 [Sphaerisporangium flaviroseum]|uniref:ATP-grasp domain-containing protein n=1 Tax=Sphaerisporangium flaviroseum TaxID=509199 RepID=A0ABP7IW85_9ACTN